MKYYDSEKIDELCDSEYSYNNEVIRLCNCYISDEAFDRLKVRIRSFPLSRVVLNNCQNVTDDKLSFLSHLKNSNGRVYINNCNVDGSFLRFLGGRSLETLVCHHNRIDNRNWQYLNSIADIEHLDLSFTGINEGIFQNLINLNIKTLDISGTHFMNNNFLHEDLNHNIQRLYLTRCHNIGVIREDIARLSKLRRLVLADCNIDSSFCEHLPSSINNLTLSLNPRIDDEIFSILSDHEIEFLHVGGTSITSSGFNCCRDTMLARAVFDIELIDCNLLRIDIESILHIFPNITYISTTYYNTLINQLKLKGYNVDNIEFMHTSDDSLPTVCSFSKKLRELFYEKNPFWNIYPCLDLDYEEQM